MADKILTDVNVCLDLLLDRRPFVETSGMVFEYAEGNHIELFVSGISFDTLFYIMRPVMGGYRSIKVLREFRKHLRVAVVNENVVDRALKAGWKDLEDALQYYSALESGCEIILTRNKADFKKGSEGSLKLLTPEEFVENGFL